MTTETLRRRNALVRFERIDPDGPSLHEPKREGDVGWDLEAAMDVTIAPGESVDVPTNIRLELPDSVWATIQARSSIVRRGLQVEAGIIDTGYRGPLFALLRNLRILDPRELFTEPIDPKSEPAFKGYNQLRSWTAENSVKINKGERVAQVLFHRTTPVWATETDVISKATQRGVDGFGSTGV